MHLHPALLMLSALSLASAAAYGSYDRRDAKVVEIDLDKIADQISSLLQSRDADPFLEDDLLYEDLFARDPYAYAEADPYSDASYSPTFDLSSTLSLRDADADAESLESWLQARSARDAAHEALFKEAQKEFIQNGFKAPLPPDNRAVTRREADAQVSGPRVGPRMAKGDGVPLNSAPPSGPPPNGPPAGATPQGLRGQERQYRHPRHYTTALDDGNGNRISASGSGDRTEVSGKGPAISSTQASPRDFGVLRQLGDMLNKGPAGSGKGNNGFMKSSMTTSSPWGGAKSSCDGTPGACGGGGYSGAGPKTDMDPKEVLPTR
ncbi:hypothetical protein MMC10_006930 [Thelotrema lepadinum]|nr:hypothetical protein [Thelotrema lepadinum]